MWSLVGICVWSVVNYEVFGLYWSLLMVLVGWFDEVGGLKLVMESRLSLGRLLLYGFCCLKRDW